MPQNPLFEQGLVRSLENQIKTSVLQENLSQAESVFGHLINQYQKHILPMSQLVLVKTREKQNQITEFIRDEANYSVLRTLRDLEATNFGSNQLSDVSVDTQNVTLPKERTNAILQRIMEQKVPTRPHLEEQFRNYFEGPINIDLMMLGLTKNIFSDGIPDKDHAVSLLSSFSNVMQHSVQVGMILNSGRT